MNGIHTRRSAWDPTENCLFATLPVNVTQARCWNLVFLFNQLLSAWVDKAGMGLEGKLSYPYDTSEKLPHLPQDKEMRSTVKMSCIYLVISWVQVTSKSVIVEIGNCILNLSGNYGKQVHSGHALTIYCLGTKWKNFSHLFSTGFWKCAFKTVSHYFSCDKCEKTVAMCEKTVATNLKGLCKCRFSNAIHPLERNCFVTSQSKYLKVYLVKSTSAAWITMTENVWVFLASQIVKYVVL